MCLSEHCISTHFERFCCDFFGQKKEIWKDHLKKIVKKCHEKKVFKDKGKDKNLLDFVCSFLKRLSLSVFVPPCMFEGDNKSRNNWVQIIEQGQGRWLMCRMNSSSNLYVDKVFDRQSIWSTKYLVEKIFDRQNILLKKHFIEKTFVLRKPFDQSVTKIIINKMNNKIKVGKSFLKLFWPQSYRNFRRLFMNQI
jgi:hypothetical protein